MTLLRRLAVAALLCFMAWTPALKAWDLNPDAINTGEFPKLINDAYYLTNSDSATSGSITVDTMRIGEKGIFTMGNGNAGGVGLDVTGDMTVNGRVVLQNSPTETYGTTLNVGKTLTVKSGDVEVGGQRNSDGDTAAYGVIEAGQVTITDGGRMQLNEGSILQTGSYRISDGNVGDAWYAVTVSDNGRLVVNNGLPVEGEAQSGVILTGGEGILVTGGGILSSGGNGGTIWGPDDSAVHVANGGVLDTSLGDLVVFGMDVVLDGSFRAGYADDAYTALVVAGGTVQVGANAAFGMSRELQSYLNQSSSDSPRLIEADNIVFTDQWAKTGLGYYYLVKGTEGGGDYISIGDRARLVHGDGSAGDRKQLRANLQDMWSSGRMDSRQADIIYNLAAPTATVGTDGSAGGNLNSAVLNSFVDGRNQTVDGYGVADQGLFEMYNAGAQWGVNNAAHNVAGNFAAGLNRRVERVAAEMDRLGEGWGGYVESGAGYGSCPPLSGGTIGEGLRGGQIWAGGFGRNEEADLDYGVSGYRYRPRGALLGWDQSYGNLTVGVAGAYGKGHYEDKAAVRNDSAITSYSGGLYGSYHAQNGFNLSAHAAFSHLDNDMRDVRGGMWRVADSTGYSWSAGARLGYDALLNDRLIVSPSAGVQRMRTVTRAHEESLGGVAVMRVGDVRRDSVLLPLDVTVGFDVIKNENAVLRLTGNVGYSHDFEGGGLDGDFVYEGLTGAGSAGVHQRSAGRNRYNLGAGLIFNTRRLDIGARYDYFKRSEETTHQAQGSVGIKF